MSVAKQKSKKMIPRVILFPPRVTQRLKREAEKSEATISDVVRQAVDLWFEMSGLVRGKFAKELFVTLERIAPTSEMARRVAFARKRIATVMAPK